MWTSAPALRRTVVTAVIALLLCFVALSRPAAAAEPPPPLFVVAVDDATMTPGQESTLRVTFTNRETTPVQFVYVMLREYKADFLGCTGTSWCSYGQDNTGMLVFNLTAPQVPIAPGESRTVQLRFRFRADLDCASHWTTDFRVWYSHYEYGQGQAAEVFDPPESIAHSTLVCPAT
ncbi:hypothetical protein [Streptomyces sp. CBMA156]|uniref:hypothetical protein n=1 Tax=Streptomyces sp. CBMA156 TaxID=1930280 RepID=UPI001661C042|nr:hypothetical protein [Streptomyces sp. CBMA156]MBD0674665.1 hypothetical protein [Streptomyces sp. CBMA156]